MALNSSGPISIGGSTSGQSIALELSLSATGQISLNDTAVRGLAGISSGAISLSNFYGKTTASDKRFTMHPYSNTPLWSDRHTMSTDTYAAAFQWSAVNAWYAPVCWSGNKSICVVTRWLDNQSGTSTQKTSYMTGMTFSTSTQLTVSATWPLVGQGVIGLSDLSNNRGIDFRGFYAGTAYSDYAQISFSTMTTSSLGNVSRGLDVGGEIQHAPHTPNFSYSLTSSTEYMKCTYSTNVVTWDPSAVSGTSGGSEGSSWSSTNWYGAADKYPTTNSLVSNFIKTNWATLSKTNIGNYQSLVGYSGTTYRTMLKQGNTNTGYINQSWINGDTAPIGKKFTHATETFSAATVNPRNPSQYASYVFSLTEAYNG